LEKVPVPNISNMKQINLDQFLSHECRQLINLMWRQNALISPNRFTQVVQIVSKNKGVAEFSGYDQNDVSEFLIFIMECVHKSLLRKVNVAINGDIISKKDSIAASCYRACGEIYSKEYSEVYPTFYGMSVTELVDVSDPENILSRKYEHYFIIDLPLPPPENKEPTLYDCFDTFIENEHLSGENAWYNEETKQKQEVYKRTVFWNFPPVLVISLKRYKNFINKDQRMVHIPLTTELNLSKYSMCYGSSKYRYRLYAVCNHRGGLMGGHYTASVCPAGSEPRWFHINDTSIVEIDPHQVISPYVSCLFYRLVEA